MEEMYSLCLAAKDIEHVETLASRRDLAHKMFQLYIKGIPEADIKQKLFSDQKNPDSAFWNVKDRLRMRIVNSILSNRSQGNEIQQAYFDCYRGYSAFKVLRGRGQFRGGLPIAKSILKRAIKYHLTEVVIGISKELSFYYSAIHPDSKKFQYHNDLLKKYRHIFDIENELEELYHQVLIILTTQKKFSEANLSFFRQAMATAQEKRAMAESYTIYLTSGNICAYCNNALGQFDQLIKICKETVAYFDTLPQMPATAKFTFLFKIIPPYIKMKRFKEAEAAVQQCLSIAPSTHINYDRTLQYYTILHFHQGNFAASLPIIEQAKKFDEEMWLILEYYAKILNGQDVRAGKFINQVPTFSKDKLGMNINILIIQILSYLVKGDTNTVIDRLPALQRYSFRYLKKKETLRSDCFINILLKLEAAYFNATNLQLKAKPYLEKLASMPLKNSLQDVDMEIVPYERLWGFVVGCLTS